LSNQLGLVWNKDIHRKNEEKFKRGENGWKISSIFLSNSKEALEFGHVKWTIPCPLYKLTEEEAS
jgi:hypothetical protein